MHRLVLRKFLPDLRVWTFIMLWCWPLLAAGQSDTVWYTRDHQPATTSDAYYYRLQQLEADGRLRVTDHYMSGELRSEFYAIKTASYKQGRYISYYENGLRHETGTYELGHKAGLWRVFHPDTNVVYRETMYSRDDICEVSCYYTRSGVLEKVESFQCDDERKGPSYPIVAQLPKPRYNVYAYMRNKFYYPRECLNAGIHGTVHVRFMVDPDGNIKNVEAIEPIPHRALAAEAVRVVSMLPPWERDKGKKRLPVPLYANFYITF